MIAANASFVPVSASAAVYLTGLGMFLLIASFAFGLIVFSFLPTLRD